MTIARKVILFFALGMVLIGLFIAATFVDEPVTFADPNFEFAVREKLNYYSKPIYKSQLLNFVKLDLGTKDIQDISGIEYFRNLEVLNLRENKIVDVRPLGSLTKLHSLDLGYNHLVDLKTANFDQLANLKLTALNLDHNTLELDDKSVIRLSDLRVLKDFTSLENLSLIDNHVTNLSPLANFSNLKTLDLTKNHIVDLEGLETLSSLEELNLRQNNLEDISGIRDLTGLNYLNLHSNPDIHYISPISGLVNLETLILRNVPIGDQIDSLEALTNLQRLNLRNSGIRDISVLVQLMAQGALQDDPENDIKAYLDILENKIPNDPLKFSELIPYWQNIHTKYPLYINTSVLPAPECSHDSGFYEEAFYLTLESDLAGASIYYTLDGAVPSKKSQKYIDPIWIDSKAFDSIETTRADVIRARIITDDGLETSPVTTRTYLVGPSSSEAFTLPTISLVTDPDNLYDPEIGIATTGNYRRRGKKWERPLHLDYFKTNVELTYTSEVLFRLHGQTSRNLSQKSFRLYGENNYDQFETMENEFFPGLMGTGTGIPVDQFKTLILRNSGNDWNLAFFRDALMHRLVDHTSMDTQAYQPVNVFLNGNYWGILNIRERMDEYYIENHYGIDPDRVLIYEVSKYEDFYSQNPAENEFLALLEFIKGQADLNDDFYENLEEQIDIENFIENQIIYMYAANDDWLENNVKFWKMKTDNTNPDDPYGQDGRWRWMIIDFDSGFIKYEKNMTEFVSLERDYTLILNTLMKNPDYQIAFINRYADLLNTAFLPEQFLSEIDSMAAALEGDIEKHIVRWSSMNNSIDQWHANIDVIREFAIKRPDVVRSHILETFGLNGMSVINLKSNPKHGYIRINSINIVNGTPGIEDPASWSGIYFNEIPISLAAIPQPGYQFSHWEGVDPNIAEDETISILLENDLAITPVFEASETD
ncbi:MAG: CotH kinase family protein [Brevefilum sp.]|nr:CotH kinase family protein [Brevefilum sp.]